MWKDIPIQWINISISSHLSFCMCVRTVRFYPLSEFQLYKTALLNIVTTFYTRPQNLFILPLTPVPFDHPLLVSPVQELALFSSVSVSLVSRGCSICGSSDFVCTRAQSCLTLWPHGLRPVRLLCPWDSPGKNSGGGCHFLLRGPSRPRGWSRGLPDPGLSPHLLSLQASTVEGLPFPPWGTSQSRGWSGGLPDPGLSPTSWACCIGSQIPRHWAARETLRLWSVPRLQSCFLKVILPVVCHWKHAWCVCSMLCKIIPNNNGSG